MENTAKFVNSKREGRMGVMINYCGYFVEQIKQRVQNYHWKSTEKTWFFDNKDYQIIRDLIVESFPLEGIDIIEIDGTIEHIQGKNERNDECEEVGEPKTFSQFAAAICKNIHSGDWNEVEIF